MVDLRNNHGLLTKWAEEVEPSNMWEAYPRPQLTRASWQNLNGHWMYCITDKNDKLPLTHFEKAGLILVPFAVESALSGVQKPLLPTQTLWYKTTFKLGKLTDRTVLHFGAVDWKATIWVNGQEIGTHLGGYCPFSYDIQSSIHEGDNELIVAVEDDTDAGLQQRGKQALSPEGLFYTAVSGIWQTVWLEQLHMYSIKQLYFESNIEAGTVNIQGEVYSNESCRVKLGVYDGERIVAATEIHVSEGHFTTEIKLDQPKLWSTEQPHLYDVTAKIVIQAHASVDVEGSSLYVETVCDQVTSYFALRKIELQIRAEGTVIVLNGKPVFQLGVLDQGYWPDGLYTAPSDEALIDDIMQMKQLGFNMLRKHIKVEQARFYYHCDRLGMLVWQDMINGGKAWNVVQEAVLPNLFPNWFRKDNTKRSYERVGRLEEANRAQFYEELREMIMHLRHFPSIVVWCPFNEGWGQFDAIKVAEYVYQLDPTRLIDHASGWFDQGGGHMRSVHTYFRPLTKPKRTYGRVPVLSEFGGYNLKLSEHSEHGHKEVGYKKCTSQDELQALYMKLLDQLEKQIDYGLAASVYTQLSDVEGEVNGLLTYDRKVSKLDAMQTKTKHHALLTRFNRKWTNEEQR